MERMMTYGGSEGANEKLQIDPPLTPSSRCLSKAIAIDNGANPDPLANFDNARLVPASVVEKQGGGGGGGEGPFTITFVAKDGSTVLDSAVYEKDEVISSAPNPPVLENRTFVGWRSTSDGHYLSIGSTTATSNVTYKATYRVTNMPDIKHFFIDESGLNMGTNYTVTVPLGSRFAFIKTKTLVNGQCPTSEWTGNIHSQVGIDYIPPGPIADIRGYNDAYSIYKGTASWTGIVTTGGKVSRGFILFKEVNPDGSTEYIYNLDEKGDSGTDVLSVYFNYIVMDEYEINNIDDWNIHLTINRSDLGYSISDGVVNLNRQPVGYSENVMVYGFTGTPIVQFVPIYSDEYCPGYDDLFSSITVNGSLLIVTRREEGGTFNLYKITDSADPSHYIYFGVLNYNPGFT